MDFEGELYLEMEKFFSEKSRKGVSESVDMRNTRSILITKESCESIKKFLEPFAGELNEPCEIREWLSALRQDYFPVDFYYFGSCLRGEVGFFGAMLFSEVEKLFSEKNKQEGGNLRLFVKSPFGMIML